MLDNISEESDFDYEEFQGCIRQKIKDIKDVFDMLIESINSNSKAQYSMCWEMQKKVIHKENLAQVLHEISEKLEIEEAKNSILSPKTN